MCTNLFANSTLHREAAIELPEALCLNDTTTTNVYEIGTRDLATLENDSPRVAASNIEYVVVRRAHQELFSEHAVAFKGLLALSIQDACKCCVLEASKHEESSAFHTPVLSLGNLAMLPISCKI